MREKSKRVGSDLSRVRLHISKYQDLESYDNYLWGFHREGGREAGWLF